MPEDILLELRDAVSRHPWWIARARLAIGFLRRLGITGSARVLDAGCGWGVTMAALEQSGYQSVGLDVSRRALEALDREGRLLIHADLTHPLPPERGTFDAVLALDVIEHVDAEGDAMRNLVQLTRPGGVLMVSVPALPALYSDFDAVQGHRRRYGRRALREAFAAAGLSIERMAWWGPWMVPALWIARRRLPHRGSESALDTYRRHLRLPAWPAPALMGLALRIDHWLTLNGLSPIGTSLIAVATPRAGALAPPSPP